MKRKTKQVVTDSSTDLCSFETLDDESRTMRYRLPNVKSGTFFCAMYDGRMVDLNDF